MTADQYWNGEPKLVKAYRKADELRQSQMNFNAWLQGRYIYDAFLCVSPVFNPFNKNPKPIPYHEEPFALTEEEHRAQRKRAERKKESERIAEETNFQMGMNKLAEKFGFTPLDT